MAFRYVVSRRDEQQERSKAILGDYFNFHVCDMICISGQKAISRSSRCEGFMYLSPETFFEDCRNILRKFSSYPCFSNLCLSDNRVIDSLISTILQLYQLDLASLDADDLDFFPKEFNLYVYVYEDNFGNLLKDSRQYISFHRRTPQTRCEIERCLKKTKVEELMNNDECPICIQELRNDEVEECLTIPCIDILQRHVFHRQCILTWLQINPSCPLCRSPLYLLSLFRTTLLASHT